MLCYMIAPPASEAAVRMLASWTSVGHRRTRAIWSGKTPTACKPLAGGLREQKEVRFGVCDSLACRQSYVEAEKIGVCV